LVDELSDLIQKNMSAYEAGFSQYGSDAVASGDRFSGVEQLKSSLYDVDKMLGTGAMVEVKNLGGGKFLYTCEFQSNVDLTTGMVSGMSQEDLSKLDFEEMHDSGKVGIHGQGLQRAMDLDVRSRGTNRKASVFFGKTPVSSQMKAPYGRSGNDIRVEQEVMFPALLQETVEEAGMVSYSR
jgi:hypothetical protein